MKPEQVRALRGKRGLTQVQLAALARVSRKFIVDIENGRTRKPRAMEFARVAQVLEVDPVVLMGDEQQAA